ncbi:glutathione peroxidase [bacterium]|jgi:glutathione peroxidase|nr:glutathione peroxidase [bacterium]
MVLEYTMTRLDGSDEDLASHRGNVLLMVNVASRCGLTPQYTALEALHEKYNPQGFEVLGFPANNFMGQEPGTDEEIAEFCSSTYGVTFPMFSKISVKGDDIHPLYAELTSMPEPIGGDVAWNFQKYLVDREGNVVRMFGPRTTPDDPEVVQAVEELLG